MRTNEISIRMYQLFQLLLSTLFSSFFGIDFSHGLRFAQIESHHRTLIILFINTYLKLKTKRKQNKGAERKERPGNSFSSGIAFFVH